VSMVRLLFDLAPLRWILVVCRLQESDPMATVKHHTHPCPECGRGLPCSNPAACAEAKTQDVSVLCERCARGKVERNRERDLR